MHEQRSSPSQCPHRALGLALGLAGLAPVAGSSPPAELAWPPLRAHPQNPYVMEFRGQPTILRTFGEAYGSVVNPNFDYLPYLDTLQRDGMNLTRVFLLGYHPDAEDTLDPLAVPAADFLQPWPRSSTGGNALDGAKKWDFSQWNEAYFTRLKAFAQACSDHGIVVEMTLFCPQYTEGIWSWCPFNPANNVQGYGPTSRFNMVRATDANLFAVQLAATRRIARELNEFDNIYFEIENEPMWNQPGTGDAAEVSFHNQLLAAIRDEESSMPNRHMVAHNFPQMLDTGTLSNDFDVINCHYPYAVPATEIMGGAILLQDHYNRGRILSLDETASSSATEVRLEAWSFILGGGGVYNALDAVYFIHTPQSEAGDIEPGISIRRTLRDLGTYADNLDLLSMRRNLSWITGGVPQGAILQAMASPGQQYAAYFHHGVIPTANYSTVYYPIDGSDHAATVQVTLEAGTWRAVWTRPSDLSVLHTEEITHAGGVHTLEPVTYQEDVVLRIDRTGAEDNTPPPVPKDVVAEAAGDGSVNLSWSAVAAEDVAFHRIYRTTESGVPPAVENLIAQVAAGSTAASDDTADPGVLQYYVVTAVDLNGNESGASSEAVVHPAGPTASAGPDQELVDHDADSVVTTSLDAGASSAGNHPIVSYSWRENGAEIASGASVSVDLAIGWHSIELVVEDGEGGTDSDTVGISVSARGLTNGSFEEGSEGWVTSGNVTFQDSAGATNGTQAAVFNSANSTPNALLRRSFPTIPGQTYQLSFDLGVLSYNLNEQKLGVKLVGSSVVMDEEFSIFGAGGGSIVWESKAETFTANSQSTTLLLTDNSAPVTNGIDMLLDRVTIHPVPDDGFLPGIVTVTRLSQGCGISMNAPLAGLYLLQRSEDLEDWSTIDEIQIAKPGPIGFTDSGAAGNRLFYRIGFGSPP